jgi:hypothetical protein
VTRFTKDRPNAAKAASIATNFRTPYDLLGKADQKWKVKFTDKLFDGTYHAGLPSTWANQKLGLATVTHLANHINTSLTRLTFCGTMSQQQDSADSYYDGTDDESFENKDVILSNFYGRLPPMRSFQ